MQFFFFRSRPFDPWQAKIEQQKNDKMTKWHENLWNRHCSAKRIAKFIIEEKHAKKLIISEIPNWNSILTHGFLVGTRCRHWRRHFETRRSPYKEKKKVIHHSYSVRMYSIFVRETSRSTTSAMKLSSCKKYWNMKNLAESMLEILIFNHFFTVAPQILFDYFLLYNFFSLAR